ncbi:hypothetical protein K4749_39640 [Streptomyces sp. TRM72054]|nr:hypothetical protein [Streptomyces sp. TRM72054]MBX9399487.1 hypothetical protein [Streptomyces sp. TRM72054]
MTTLIGQATLFKERPAFTRSTEKAPFIIMPHSYQAMIASLEALCRD